MYFQLKSTSLDYVQTDVNHHMVKEVEQYIEYFKNFIDITLFISNKIQKVVMGTLSKS